ncbi:hypothetical protein CK203_082777 [Vitis vinifera]|uniref:Uncharacterized protein n=1 Tax=Vitis vinifera TaxID=29760 RepID=A0A438DXP5_VITVI|nr:hypothetical protein CK203_082777 [Vitis vinifera]
MLVGKEKVLYLSSDREQYAKWKEQCCQMFPVIGSGRYITAPIITDDGQPIQDPLVLLEANPQKGSALPHDNGDAQDSELSLPTAQKQRNQLIILQLTRRKSSGSLHYIK